MKEITFITAQLENIGRPAERPPKTNRTIEFIKWTLRRVQHVAPGLAARVIWHYFTKPGPVRFTDGQAAMIGRAELGTMTYKGDTIVTYKWGHSTKRAFLAHGWRSKTVDFRRMIESFLDAGYEVHGFDLRAHGKSEGTHSAMPEYRDLLKTYFENHAPFDVVVGYSLGGIAAGMAISELPERFYPGWFYALAAPPYIRYFFKDMINDVGCNEAVYERMCELVEKYYGKSIDYFDLRLKNPKLRNIKKHLIYCEDDVVVPIGKGQELFETLDNVSFVHTRGLGHYQILAYKEVIDYILETSEAKVNAYAMA
jgi:pimeloyl-ACP methyl ester carboxylesterase